MTYKHTINQFNLERSTGFYIGLDKLTDLIEYHKNNTYPPFNVIMLDECAHMIEVATAGFSKQELAVSVRGVYLIISGKKEKMDNRNFLLKGIAARNFTKQFILSNGGFVTRVILNQNILQIVIKYPATPMTRNINIETSNSDDQLYMNNNLEKKLIS